MEADTSILRVLLEPRASDTSIWIATCLETGYVLNGRGLLEAREAILEALRDDANEHDGDLAHAYRPVSAELEAKWENAVREYSPEEIELFPPDGPDKKSPGRVGQAVRLVRTGT